MPESSFSLKTPDGVTLDCVLNEPSDPGDHPERTILLVHGITADLDESGAFQRLAGLLAAKGMRTIRFSFRGHGKSTLPSEFMTCAGEAIDLRTVVDHCIATYGPRLSIVAASFGAVSVSILARYLNRRVRSLCLWNPVLKVESTFLKPTLPWGISNFTGENIANLYEVGNLTIDNSFTVGVVFWEELQYIGPSNGILHIDAPVVIIHGDLDSYVPYPDSLEFARANPRASLITISGSDHGFEFEAHERQVLEATTAFLSIHA